MEASVPESSLRNHLESLPALKEAAHSHDVSVNDLFVGACAEAAVRYHREFGVELDQVRATVVILENMCPMGPVTGTAFNITMLSYNDRCYFGVHIDPAAVSDTELLIKSIALSFRQLGVDWLP